MKKKVLIKWIIGCGMLCMMLLVLWKRTHINYDEYSEKTSDMQHEEVEEIRFPDYINEKVSDGLVFDAEVVIGENFDPDNFYVSTARIMKPDEEKWKQFFGVDNTWDYNVYETESRIGDKIEFQTYTDKQENTLYLTSEEALWAKQDMVFIYNVLDTNEYSPQNNGKLFSEKMDLSFESRQDNLRTVLDKMQQIGIDAVDLYNTMTIKIPIETKQGVHTLPASSVIAVEAQGRKVVIHTTQRDFESIRNMQYWLELLPKNCFFQTHRSFIINFEHVTDFDRTLVHMADEQFHAYLTKRKYSAFKEAYLLYLDSTR